MTIDPSLVFSDDDGGLLVNFGVFAGREATPAEIYRLGEALLELVPAVEVVAEQRYEFDRQAQATVYQLRVSPTGDGVGETVTAWAADCIRERGFSPG